MFCTTIIPTINRDTLSRSVESVLNQDIPSAEFEVIVVNDTGNPLPDYSWAKSPRVRIYHTQRHNRSVARNLGASVAQGEYLHFLDDDDWMLEGAFERLWEISSSNTAQWIYGGYKLVDSNGKLLRNCFPDEEGNCFIRFLSNEWLPIQASIIRADSFFEAGGFTPGEYLNEDVELAQRLTYMGTIGGTQELIAVIRFGQDNTSTDYSILKEKSRTMRANAVRLPGAYTRAWDSAVQREVNQEYWRGKLVWIYLTSAIWNLRLGRPFSFASLLFWGIVGAFSSVRYFTTPHFWRGVIRSHITKGWLEKKID